MSGKSRKRILLAEDDDEMRSLLSSLLRRAGYDVVECADGFGLLEQLEGVTSDGKRPFDVVITDVVMPRFDGIEALECLDYICHTPRVIVISAFGSAKLHRTARELGAAAFLDKPFDMSALLQTVRRVTGEGEGLVGPVRRSQTRSECIPARESARGDAARTKARILLAEDDPDMRSLVAGALRRAGYEVVECADGIDLLERIGVGSPCDEPLDFDLIISDNRMPGISGLSLLEGLSEWDELKPLRMILTTAFGDSALRRQARKLGALAFFDKPFELRDLVAAVREVLPTRLDPLEG